MKDTERRVTGAGRWEKGGGRVTAVAIAVAMGREAEAIVAMERKRPALVMTK